MVKQGKLIAAGSALALLVSWAALVSADGDCSMCHDEAPLPASHMPVDEVSVEACTMCHEASGDDAFFRVVHEKHGEALGCDTCHSDASPEAADKLKQMLGN